MSKRWIITISIILVVTFFLIWGQARSGMAAKDERFWPMKILEKLDKVIENQMLILKEIRELKGQKAPTQ